MAWRNEFNPIVENMIIGLTGQLPGNHFYMDPVKGSDGGDGSRWAPKKTLDAGYKLLRDGYNDVLFFVPGASPVALTASFVWAKSYAHLIGLAGPGVYGGRCRIHDSAAFAGILFSMTGAGNIFKSIHWQRDFDSALGVENVTLGSVASYNYFEDCQFDAPIYSSLGAATYRNLSGVSGSKSNTFRRCTVGAWNQTASAADGIQIYLPGDNGEWHFMDCVVLWNTSNSSMVPITITDLVSEYCYVLFNNCRFLGVGTSVTALCSVPAHGKVHFMDPRGMGYGVYSATSSGHVIVSAPVTAGDDQGGIGVAVTA